jgi:hypothetical protein
VSNVYPADVLLSLPAGRHLLGLRRLAVTEAVRSSFDQALAAVGRQCGPVVGKRRLEELVVEAAVDVDSLYRARVPLPCSRDMPLVIQADGKGVVMRPEALREATRRKAAQAATQGRRGRLAALRRCPQRPLSWFLSSSPRISEARCPPPRHRG